MPNNNIPSTGLTQQVAFSSVTPARAEDWLRTIYQTVSSQPAASTSQAAVITSPPRARGWVLISTRAGLAFSESSYTNNTQSMALAKFVKSVKSTIKDHVNMVNDSLNEIARLKQTITKAEALVVDDSVPVSPAEPSEPEASEQPASEQLASDSDTWGLAEPGYDSSIDTVNSSGATPTPEVSQITPEYEEDRCGDRTCPLCYPNDQ